MLHERATCKQCGQRDSVVELPERERVIHWGEHDGRRYRVRFFRCLACASIEWQRRKSSEASAKQEFADGLRIVATEIPKKAGD